MENITLTFKVELTPKQSAILSSWENMNQWVTCEIEKMLFEQMIKMNNPTITTKDMMV